MRILTAATSLFAILLCAPLTATADELVLETRFQTSYPTDTSYDVVSDRNALSGVDLGAGWQFDGLAGLRTLVMFQTTAPGRLDANLFQGDADIEWGRQRVLGVLDFGVSPYAWLRPFARVGLGYSHQYLSVQTTGPRLRDNAHDLAGFGSGGVDLVLPVSFGAFGLSSQFGYTLQTPATFDELTADAELLEVDGEADPWTREPTSLGSLDTDGLFWDLGVTFQLAF